MPLQLKDLQKVARKTIAEELAFETFRGALARALGPALVIDCPVDEFIENVNEQLDILELTGKSYRVQVPTSVLLPLAEHKLAGVRKVVARLISEDRVTMFAKDTDVSVRAVVARRAPLEDVKRMAVHEGRSDLIKSIYRQRALFESGIPNVKPIKEPFTMYADKAMGKSGKSPEGPELSDQWYETKAQELFDTYGQDNIEYNWEEIAVHRLCSSTKAASGVELDEEKLLKALIDVIEEYEDRCINHYGLDEAVDPALRNALVAFPGEVPADVVTELYESDVSAHEYVERAMQLFKVQEATAPMSLSKYAFGKKNLREMKVPMMARLPHAGGFRAIDERALDRFVKNWNEVQRSGGEPLELQWSPSPLEENRVSFNVILR